MGLNTSKAQLLEDLQHEQAEFEALLAAIGEDHMTQPGVAGEWSIKDVVAHLTAWRRRTVKRFQAAARHEPDPPTGWPAQLQTDDEINAWFAAADRDRSLSAVLGDSHAVFDQMVEAIAAIPEPDLQDPARFPWWGDETWNGAALFGHFHEEHEADLRSWLARVRQQEQ